MASENLLAGYRYAGGYVGLPYETPLIASTLEIDGETLVKKSEFHMSIFCVKKYAPEMAQLKGVSEEDAEQTILEEASRLLKQFPISIEQFKDEFRLAEERDKKTVVVMCQAKNLQEFFDGMRQALGMDFLNQPTHVTLYTRENGSGIGLPDPEEVAKITRLLTPEETESVKNAINFESL
ncbi:MAG: hypothetical protein HZB70_00395 [Candidatus Berkelbacteria bacterium]|nr:MAG: hypothetical protein HZB70_00395 [Candidatus Berkelbacteria bacterium]QQG51434.1 MAG: hypothetical protein HY845_02605 [Candidatus Berkelbacteria bacterium]